MKQVDVIQQMMKAGLLACLPGDMPLQSIIQAGDARPAAPVIGVEVQFQDGEGGKLIADLTRRAGSHLVVGAGNVDTITMAEQALQAGAHFISSPRLNFELMSYCSTRHVFYIPGVISVLAAQAVQQSGGRFVRLRTGGDNGPDFMQAMKQAIPGIHVLVSGCFTHNEVGDYARSGAFAVLLEDALYTTNHAQPVADIIKRARVYQTVWDEGMRNRNGFCH